MRDIKIVKLFQVLAIVADFPALMFPRAPLEASGFFITYFLPPTKRKAELSPSPLPHRKQCHYIQTTDVNVNGTIKTHLQVNPVPHQVETVMIARRRIVTVTAETDTTATRINMEVEVVHLTEIVVATEEVQVLLESLGSIHHHQRLLLTLLQQQVLPKS